jgi:alkylhydroperoxidase family enzyme
MYRTTIHKPSSAPFRQRLLAGLLALAIPLSTFAAPRIEPVPENGWSEAQREIATSAAGTMENATSTYLQHPVLAADILPFQQYISSKSTLPARDRELLILRTAWLCRSNYVWAHHAQAARGAGVSDEELARIAQGPDAQGWNSFEAALVRAADELHVDSFVSDATWKTLAASYTNEQLVDLVFTVGEFTMIAGTVNSLGVEIEPELADRLPFGIPYRVAAKWTNERLIGKQPRIVPLERAQWTAEMRRVLDPKDSGRPVANVYGTYIYSVGMDVPRRRVSEHIRNATTLMDWQREVLLLRIGVLCRSEYEWAAHSRIARRLGLKDTQIDHIIAGSGQPSSDPIEDALLRAADELYRDDVLSDETWTALTKTFDTRQLLDILTAVGGYRMFSMAINSFGVQLDANMMDVRFPPHLR